MYNSDKYDFSTAQKNLFEWLMATLGFNDDNFTSLYIDRLSTFRYRSTRKIPAALFKVIYTNIDNTKRLAELEAIHPSKRTTKEHEEYYKLHGVVYNLVNYEEQIIELKHYGFRTFKDGDIKSTLNVLYQSFGSFYIPINYKIIDFIADEYRIKERNLLSRVINPNLNAISATDIANFIYCPVAYTISKTFEQEKLLAAEIGTLLHEQNILKNLLFKLDGKIKGITIDSNFKQNMNVKLPINLVDDFNEAFFKDIAKAELVKTGHNTNGDYYHNHEMNFVGMPDYVYKLSNNNHFIIEEKFILIKDNRGTPPFFDNHRYQLASYISLINEINVEYGYLVYWLYLFDWGKPKVQKCIVQKMQRTPVWDADVMRTKGEIEVAKTGKEYYFIMNEDRIHKCAGCVYNRICGHKTGRYNTYKFPYENNFLQTFKVKYYQNSQDNFINTMNSIKINDDNLSLESTIKDQRADELTAVTSRTRLTEEEVAARIVQTAQAKLNVVNAELIALASKTRMTEQEIAARIAQME